MLRIETGAAVHGTAIVVGETGVLFVGPSGSGKSVTALRCLASARARGLYAALVSDDQTILEIAHGRVLARCPPSIAGVAEIRGTGLVDVAWRKSALLSAVVAPGEPDGAGRLPPSGEMAEIGGVRLPLARFFSALPLDPLEILPVYGMFGAVRPA